jgi:hypothetical protein
MVMSRTEAELREIADEILFARDENVDRILEHEQLTPSEAQAVSELVELGAKQLKNEAEWMTAWAERERANGRHEAELTWRNCVRETGVLSCDGLKAQ